MTTVSGYVLPVFVKYEFMPATGTTTTMPGSNYDMFVNTNTSTIAAHTLNLPTNPVDGQIFLYSNFATITALTFSPSVQGWTNGSTLTAGTGLWLMYSVPSATWFVMNY